MAPQATSPALTLTGSDRSYPALTIPELQLPQAKGNRGMLAKLEENMQFHNAAMYAYERKAECFIEVNMSTADKSGDAFTSLTLSSAARMNEVKGMMFEKDIHLAEFSFRQSFLNALDANLRDMARQTGMLATMSILPMPEDVPKKGFLARLFG